MLGNLTTAILLGIGSAGWIYAKTMRSSGSNVKSSLIVAIVSGAVIIVGMTIVLDLAFKK
jgi:hypothetical protein